MKRAFLEPLAEAAYNARREAQISGAYPKSVVRIPDSEHFHEWDALPTGVENRVKSLYNNQAQATLHAFFAQIYISGTPEAKKALAILLQEMQDTIFTGVEVAELESYQAESTKKETRH